ncbi:hypothetical protein HaLaN_21804 [Haematococcus lacustris]|uniref:Uncharacterized protein n=1 Tax=Haematococcus lacustris TaxID=44745 RepID=A0A699ZSD7_HAELA|nr:hypothetical protein HaLaN_21804 [Haematococcus lacustris]
MLRGKLSLGPGSVGYIAKWLRVAERYQLAWLKDVVLAAWKEMPISVPLGPGYVAPEKYELKALHRQLKQADG